MRSSLRSAAPPPSLRRRLRFVASLLVGVLLGAVLAALPAAAASATIQNLDVDCTALTIRFESFPDDEPVPNRLTIEIDGVLVQDTTFGAALVATQAIADPTTPHRYRVVVVAAGDAPGPDGNGPKGWSRTYTGSSPVCAVPTVQVSATVCTTPGGSSSVRAVVEALDPAREYEAVLRGPGGVLDTDRISGVARADLDFGPRPPGATYTVSVTDVQAPSVVGRGSVTARPCAQVGGVSAEIQQCAIVGGRGAIVFTDTALTPGATYLVRSGSTTGQPLGSFVYTPGQDRYSVPLVAGQSYTLFLVDQQGVLQLGPIPVELAACPSASATVSATPAPCTLGAAGSAVLIRLGDLTVGRSYRVLWDGQPVGSAVIASATTATVTIPDAAPGQHSIRVVDDADATVEVAVTVPTCAATPSVSVSPTPCSTPGGTGSLSVALGQLVPSRSYRVELTADGAPVPGYPARVVTATTATTALSYDGLSPDARYDVAVIDLADARATATASATVAACPSAPDLVALVTTCSPQSGTSTIQAAVSALPASRTWDVRLLEAGSDGVYRPVVDRPGLTAPTPADLRFANVQNGARYRVVLASTRDALSAEASIVPARCAVSAVEYTADPGGTAAVSSLARTGIDTVASMVGALTALLLGVSLLVIAAIRRRGGAEN